VNWILAIPLEVRLILLFLLGTVYGALANLAVYGLAWNLRPISPWMIRSPAAPPRHWFDRIPIFGWLALRREAKVHGMCFWIRPLLVEFICGLGLAALYYWEIEKLALLPVGTIQPVNPVVFPTFFPMLHEQYLTHVILIWLMLVASLIDVDEKTIPDAITRSGTLLGLIFAALWPWSLRPDVIANPIDPLNFYFLRITSTSSWPVYLAGFPHVQSLIIALACWLMWCPAIMPRTWYARHGWRRALKLCWARAVREIDTYLVFCMCLLGIFFIVGVWYHNGLNWTSLLSALVGMAAGAGIIWAVRIVGTAVLKQEAMGFGDVTLMAMIGAFLGWQACLIILFLAALTAVLVAVLRLIFLHDREIYFGPFLCLGALIVIIYWAPIWNYTAYIFALGWILPLMMLACLALMAPLLMLLRLISNLIFTRR
jgi:leader peptidase (prepilin peptidase)/N-methyltransferase